MNIPICSFQRNKITRILNSPYRADIKSVQHIIQSLIYHGNTQKGQRANRAMLFRNYNSKIILEFTDINTRVFNSGSSRLFCENKLKFLTENCKTT
jgi:hypothetical protein